MTTLFAAMAVLVLAAAMPPPAAEPGPLTGLGGWAAPPMAEAVDADDEVDDTERQSVLVRAMPKRLAPPPSTRDSLRDALSRTRMSSPRKSAQFTPTGVLDEGGDSDMISDPGPAHAHHQQYADDDGVPRGVPRYPSSGVTREIEVRQGRLVGVVRTVPGFGEVHQFLGLPYAEPPVGSQRFMPPASPSQWKGLRVADRFGHVCPQALPDLTLQDMSPGRLSQVQRLRAYLEDNQSEDCLYLNVYTPAQATSRAARLPVIVYIHGESLEWNAGTPYDGSALAAYGKVIVVTFNFRLGILGFLRPGVHDSTVSNFGLLDQVAALQWVKDNIGALGGDPLAVTIMGHSTGAACAALLLVSPVSSNLFKRAILMSGTALADWALTPSPLQFTIQVAEGLNCPLDDQLGACLRRKRLSDLLAVKVTRPAFKTAFGPVVDGSVIPNEPVQLMGTYRELFSRYDLLLGVTEHEAYHLLDSKSLAYGVLERDRDALLKRYTHARFEKHPDVALARTLAEYAQDAALAHPVAAEGQRELLLDILSDARVVAPVVRTAELHAEANRSSFLYVFTHRTKATNYPAVYKSVQGDELDYVFGLPLTPAAVRPGRVFTRDEKHLSEQIITMWTNFAKSGNPNMPRTQTNVFWEEFDAHNMAYLNISIPSSTNYRYRDQQMKYWNHDLPDFMRHPQPPLWPDSEEADPDPEPDAESPDAGYGSPRHYQSRQDPYEEPARSRPAVYGTPVYGAGQGQGDTPLQRPPLSLRPLGPRLSMPPPARIDVIDSEPREAHDAGPEADARGDAGRVSPSTLAMSVVIVVGISFLLVNACAFGFLYYKKNRLRMQQQFFSSQCRGAGLEDDAGDAYTKKTLPATDGGFSCATASSPPPPPPLPLPPQQQQPRIGLGQRLRLLLNRAGSGGSLAQRGRRQTRGAGVGAPSAASHHRDGRDARADSRDDLYEAVSSASRSTSRTGLAGRGRPPGRDDAADTHSVSKVRDWVAQEVVQRCSPGFLQRGRRASAKPPLSHSSSLDQACVRAASPGASPETRTGMTAKAAVQKVSVAVDATPAARSSSVLRQLPIELSKSMEETARCGAQSDERPSAPGGPGGPSGTATMTRSTPTLCPRPSLLRSEAVSADEVDGPPSTERRRSITSIHLDLQPSVVDIVVPGSLQASPPASPAAPLHSFFGPRAGQRDVNVTSRDEAVPRLGELCPEEALDTIRRRNYPKVLPDFPGAMGLVEASSPQLTAMQMAAARRRSLPPGQLQMLRAMPCCPGPGEMDPTALGRRRPAPPPRVSSTLGRRPHAGARVLLPATPELSATPDPPDCRGGPPSPAASPVVRYEPRVVIRARESCEEEPSASPTQTSSSSMTLRRPEPRVIIKASSANPVRAAGDDDDYGFAKAHPKVHLQHAAPPPGWAVPASPATPATPAPAPPPASPTPARGPPAIAPKPVLKPAPKEQDAATPNGSLPIRPPSPPRNGRQEEAAPLPPPSSPEANKGVTTKTPPAPPPMPNSTKHQKHSRKGSEGSNHQSKGCAEHGGAGGGKAGPIKRGKRK